MKYNCFKMDSIGWFFVNLLVYTICVHAQTNSATGFSEAIVLFRVPRDAFINTLEDGSELPIQELHMSMVNNSVFHQRYSTDNRKPAFRGCKDYSPKLKEEQPSNTFVIKVEANDPDDDLITYSFEKSLTERAKFRINSKTGEIVTSYTFDRDEPIREKEVYVTVRATDNGRPPLDDICTFKITIEDINDNPPVFDKVKYEQSIAEDTQINKSILSISAYDFDDGDNSVIKYELLAEKDSQYFRIDENNGLLYLVRPIDRKPGQHYTVIVRVSNIVPEYPQDAQTEVLIKIIESNKKPPIFLNAPSGPIYLLENFTDYSQSLITLQAISNVPEKSGVIFELITGRTEPTNNKKTFVFNQIGDTASISLGMSLDYEAITEYTLTMSVKNIWDLVAEVIIKIKVEDVNDNIPFFTEVTTGTILENEASGTPVMQVRAFDNDGTTANNIVSFELADNTEFFTIDPHTGNITALTTFDREEKDYYNVKVIATDNSPSSLYKTGQHNKGQQVFRIEIADKNDHPPVFVQKVFHVRSLMEDANKNFKVIEVTAIDKDNAAQIRYSIEDGNIGEAFKIDSTTGVITVNGILDYENITEYNLKIRAFDGIYEDTANVIINIENINDNPPVFLKDSYNTTIEEEVIVDNCILNIEAYDPDIKDRNEPQFIKYFIVKTEQQSLLKIDATGCLRLIQPLDRDAPDGHKNWQVVIAAVDENGNGLRISTDVIITLIDINDNAPILSNQMPVVWYENQQPSNIVKLTAVDFDEPQNGAPFFFDIDMSASKDIKEKFSIAGDYLIAMDVYDREKQKEYFIPISISDSGLPRMQNVSILHLIIGDVNDNKMQEGSSEIFVYNYNGEAPDNIEIGRVYVDDPDDWDLPDKTFKWKDNILDDRFGLNSDNGMITMHENVAEGIYKLYFNVTESSRVFETHSVIAIVDVTVKYIPEEAVDKSGSIRFKDLSPERFIVDNNAGKSIKDIFRDNLAKILNISNENVDVFTVLKNDDKLDVRFSAHGSPYYEAERLNAIAAQNQNELVNGIDLNIQMINIDECLIEKQRCPNSCTNVLHKSNVPLLVYTNKTSFVGINAFTQADCSSADGECSLGVSANDRYTCLNGGTPVSFASGAAVAKHGNEKCSCLDGFDGPHCELTSIGFRGDGYAMYPPIAACDSIRISLEVLPQSPNGLLVYMGPLYFNPALPLSDFLTLELIRGFPVLSVDYGSGTVRIEHKHKHFSMGQKYHIDIMLQKNSIEMTVDSCKLSTCMSLGAPQGPNEFLNVNAPVQLGGASVNFNYLASKLNWSYSPQNIGYNGCIQNFTVNGQIYNIGAPSIFKNADPGCHRSIAFAVSFGINANFIIAILVCIALLLILFLAVVVHKRHQDGWHEKDIDDIRETIINYEDEGGGERDTDYDLNVLRSPAFYDDHIYKKSDKGLNEIPDIAGFLVEKMDTCDKDTDAYLLDDVRHYAYEGDGNSSRSSLSSLASCTDDGDLRFDYLSNFGPRFKRLADEFGFDSDEEDDDDVI